MFFIKYKLQSISLVIVEPHLSKTKVVFLDSLLMLNLEMFEFCGLYKVTHPMTL